VLLLLAATAVAFAVSAYLTLFLQARVCGVFAAPIAGSSPRAEYCASVNGAQPSLLYKLLICLPIAATLFGGVMGRARGRARWIDLGLLVGALLAVVVAVAGLALARRA
jgi:hypothetical protein